MDIISLTHSSIGKRRTDTQKLNFLGRPKKALANGAKFRAFLVRDIGNSSTRPQLPRTCTYKLQGRLDTMRDLLCLCNQGWDGCTPVKFRLR
jgi:hypothetical protein